jgi:hypothetical protein
MGCSASRNSGDVTNIEKYKHMGENMTALDIYMLAREIHGERKEVLFPVSRRYQNSKQTITSFISTKFTEDGIRVRVRWFDEIEPNNPSSIVSFIRIIFE